MPACFSASPPGMTVPSSSASPSPTSGRKSCAIGLRSASPRVPMRRTRGCTRLFSILASAGDVGREARGAVREAGQPNEQSGAHLVGVEEVADADGARHHRLALESRDLVGPSAVSTAAPSPVLRP